MKSNWELTKNRSLYHFNTDIMDSRWDTAILVKKIPVSWADELDAAIEASYPVSWRTRGKPGDALARPSEEFDREEYDLEQIGMPKDYVVTNINYELGPELQRIVDSFGLEKTMARLHVQRPGQLWNLHIDKLEKWMPEDPSKVERYFVQLTDWVPGHFWNFGNFQWSRWKAGDVVTFDWQNVPHSTANSGLTPRVTLQVTGVRR